MRSRRIIAGCLSLVAAGLLFLGRAWAEEEHKHGKDHGPAKPVSHFGYLTMTSHPGARVYFGVASLEQLQLLDLRLQVIDVPLPLATTRAIQQGSFGRAHSLN